MKVSQASMYFDRFDLQSLTHRAPEVLFGVPFGTQIDVWSVGCVIFEVYKCVRLFECIESEDLVRQMMAIFGPIPISPFQHGMFFSKYFGGEGEDYVCGKWKCNKKKYRDMLERTLDVYQNAQGILSERLAVPIVRRFFFFFCFCSDVLDWL